MWDVCVILRRYAKRICVYGAYSLCAATAFTAPPPFPTTIGRSGFPVNCDAGTCSGGPQFTSVSGVSTILLLLKAAPPPPSIYSQRNAVSTSRNAFLCGWVAV